MASGSNRVVLAALGANLIIALFKLIVALMTGSSAMMAEASHSLADTANQAFLLLGVRLSRRPPDDKHPFGYATETYFWAFIVALCLFSVGAAFSIWEGIHKLTGPAEPLRSLPWAFGVLGVSFVLELYSFSVARKEFRTMRGGRTVAATVAATRDPVVLTVLFEDSAALFGLAAAGGGLALYAWTGDPRWDGAASIVVGLALGAVAFVLARESRDLLLGESVPVEARRRIREIVEQTPAVARVVHVRTMHLGPHEVLCALKVKFADGLGTGDIEDATDEIERRLRAEMPMLTRIYVEAGGDDWSTRHRHSSATPGVEVEAKS
jgi:cation diffusion facilitator family transporter